MKVLIGRKDRADFPDLKLINLDIKIDTGAYSSAIHCHHIEEKQVKGRKILSFQLLDPSHPKYNNKKFQTTEYHQKQVKNSFGQSEKRFVIDTSIVLFGETYNISLSLSERSEMRYPVLIGRKFLMGKYLVDVSKSNISYRKKNLKL